MSGELTLTLIAVFCSVALVTGTLASMTLSWNAPGRRRLREMTRLDEDGFVAAEPSLTQSLAPAIQRFASIVPKSPKELGRLRGGSCGRAITG